MARPAIMGVVIMIWPLFTIILIDAGVVFDNVRALAGDFVSVHRMNICRSRAHTHRHGKHDAEPKSGRTYERGKFHCFTVYPFSMSKSLNNYIYSVRPVVMASVYCNAVALDPFPDITFGISCYEIIRIQCDNI